MQGKSRIYLCSACLSIPVRSQELCTALIFQCFQAIVGRNFWPCPWRSARMIFQKSYHLFLQHSYSENVTASCADVSRSLRQETNIEYCPHNEIRLGWLWLWFELSQAELWCDLCLLRLSKGVISPKFPTNNRLSLSVIYGIYRSMCHYNDFH